MNIILTGFMGTGKTIAGRRVADALRMPFHDVDETIEAKAGRRVAHIFSEDGEAAFRAMEREAVAGLASKAHIVIATGGGALMDPQNREVLSQNGLLICLTASIPTLLMRLKTDQNRPLLKGEGDLSHRLERLMAERDPIYRSCPIQIATDGKTVSQVVQEILNVVKPRLEQAS